MGGGGAGSASAPTSTSTTRVVSLPPVTEQAAEAAAELAVAFGWDDAVVACVAGRLDADPALLETGFCG
jgi:hypothetical protein